MNDSADTSTHRMSNLCRRAMTCFVAVFAACGGGSEGGPTVESFTATPSTVASGGSVVLSWSVKNADSIVIVATPGDQVVSTAQLTGTQMSAAIAAETTFRLVATKGEQAATKSITVRLMDGSAPVVVGFVADPAIVELGSPTTLTWSTLNAESVDIAADGRAVITAGPASGSMADTPTAASTSYVLTARGSGGMVTATAVVTTTPGTAPVIVEFWPYPEAIITGGTSDLVWAVNGSALTITIAADGTDFFTSTEDSGFTVVSPAATTEYTLTARNAAGTAMQSVTLTVSDTCIPTSGGASGCADGQKCTWINIQDTPEDVGRLGCVPNGPVPLDSTCTRGAPGEATGYDNCRAGSICIGGTTGTCKQICSLDGAPDGACPQGDSCTRYSGLFSNGDTDALFGACNHTCDPLRQTQLVNGVPTDCGPGQGCYLLASSVDTIAICAGAGTPRHNEPIVGTTFANSCAPGHVPRQAEQGVSGNECAALCKPADVYIGNNEQYEGGDSRELNWENMPATCESAGGVTVRPEVPTTGETCTFYWTREPAEGITAFSNTLGWCFNHASWRYDPDGMEPINNTDPYPRCITLTTSDVVPPLDGQNDALYFGCIAQPSGLRGGWRAPTLDRSPARPPLLDGLGSYKR